MATSPATSEVAEDVGFAAAPRHSSRRDTHWPWTWALAIPDSSKQTDLAKEFITWATSNDNTELVAEHFGWANVPPGAREEIYSHQGSNSST